MSRREIRKVFARKKPGFSQFSSSSAQECARGVAKEGGNRRGWWVVMEAAVLLVEVAMLGVASEGSKKEV